MGHWAEPGAFLPQASEAATGEVPLALEAAAGEAFQLLPCLVLALALVVALEVPLQEDWALVMQEAGEVALEAWGLDLGEAQDGAL